MSKAYIGLDNGVSGSIGIISDNEVRFYHSPIQKVLNYTKSKQWLNRIDGIELTRILGGWNTPMILIERPMVNPGRFKATISAIRALEATLIVLETLRLPYQYLDSREWQKVMLPSGLEGIELKDASLEVGKRLFPTVEFKGFKDADGLLIAEYARRTCK